MAWVQLIFFKFFFYLQNELLKAHASESNMLPMERSRTGLSFVDVGCFLLPTTGSGDPVKEFGFYPKMIKPQGGLLGFRKILNQN